MKKTVCAALLAVLSAAAFAPAAPAATGDCRELMTLDDPPVPTGQTVCRQDAWFHQSDARLGNQSAVPSWDTAQPAASFQDGGAVYAALRPIDMLQSSSSSRPTFTGKYTGTLDNIALTIYNASAYSALGGANSLYSKLTIDGKVVWINEAADDPEIEAPVEKVDDTTNAMRFAYTGIAARLKALRKANDPATEHTITVSFVNKYWGDSNFLMFYDATEYPSGLIFNLEPDPDTGSLDGYAEVATD